MKHAFHVQITVAQKTMTFGFEKPSIKIGRLPDNDLVLPDPSVEEHYGWVELTKQYREAFRLRPFVGREQNIPNGDSVAIGRYALTLVSGDAPGEAEAEFLDHLLANPSDDTTRTVYSDWLEENGRTEAAEFVRAQLTLATAQPDTDEFRFAKNKLHALADRFPSHWRRTIARPPIENCDVRFELQCPKQWGQLTPTNDPTQRFCGTCQRNVHYAPTVTKARSLAIAGQCVVVDVGQVRSKDDLEEEERYMLAGMIAPPSYS
jgi:uncharacterized protein (TIGR02996 family)